MSTAAALEAAAARLRVEATRLDTAVTGYLDSALRLLPQVWVGPAADQLEREVVGYRASLRGVAGDLRARAGWLDRQAAELRVRAVSPDVEMIAGAL